MEKSLIDLRIDNYKQYLSITPVAFSYAEGGTMGSPNEVKIGDIHNVVSRMD